MYRRDIKLSKPTAIDGEPYRMGDVIATVEAVPGADLGRLAALVGNGEAESVDAGGDGNAALTRDAEARAKKIIENAKVEAQAILDGAMVKAGEQGEGAETEAGAEAGGESGTEDEGVAGAEAEAEGEGDGEAKAPATRGQGKSKGRNSK